MAESPGNTKDGSDGYAINIVSPDVILLRKYSYVEANSREDAADGYPAYANYIKRYLKADTIIGDFNGDGKLEKAWFKTLIPIPVMIAWSIWTRNHAKGSFSFQKSVSCSN
ncbi:MAG: hypothetical protein NT040_18585 [Bacteroidetes bacterium]|nr:hypothetical protein [Bacteroidota bacterium]